MALSRKKIGLIHVAKARLNLSDEDYRSMLHHAAGVESARDLDDLGFEVVMDDFSQAGFKSKWREENLGYRPMMASPAQVALIRNLWAEYTDGEGDDLSLGKWLSRTFKVAALRFLPVERAPKAITALMKMKERKLGGPGTDSKGPPPDDAA